MRRFHISSPDISIIIPVFNRASLMKRAIESALYDNGDSIEIEVIVVDDGSTDDSMLVAQSFGEPVKVFRQQNSGPSTARNHGLAKARGQYVRFLDSDDWLIPGANKAQVIALQETRSALCYGNWRHAYERGEGQNIEESDLHSIGNVDDLVGTLLDDRWNPPFCYVIQRELIHQVGGWDTDQSLLGAEDFDFILRIAMSENPFVYVNCDIGRYLHHSNSRVSRANRLKWLNAKQAVIKKYIQLLNGQSAITYTRRNAIATSLLKLAKNYYGQDRQQFERCLDLLKQVAPDYQPPGYVYSRLVKYLGYKHTEAILEIRRRLWASGWDHYW